MKATAIMAALLIVAIGLSLDVAWGQQAGFKRTDLQQHDLSVPGREAIQVRVEIAPGFTFPKHWHPGEEIIYVLEGSLEYDVEGKPPVTLRAGDVLFIPAETIHSEERRQQQRSGARHVCRRKKQAARQPGQVSAQTMSSRPASAHRLHLREAAADARA